MNSKKGTASFPAKDSKQLWGLLQVHLAILLFGLSGLFGKFLSCSPVYIVLGRCVFAALCLVIFAGTVQRNLRQFFITRPMLIMLTTQGLLLSIHWFCFFHSIQLAGVGVGLVTFSTFPLFVTILEPLIFNEPLQKKDIITSLAVFTGIILVVPDIDISNHITVGALWGIASGATFAILSLVNRKSVNTCSSVAVAFYQDSFAALFLIIPAMVIPREALGFEDIFSMFLLGSICTALAHTLFIHSLTKIRAQTASVIACLEPVYGIILAFFLLKEIPTLSTLAGGFIIIGVSLYASWPVKKLG